MINNPLNKEHDVFKITQNLMWHMFYQHKFYMRYIDMVIIAKCDVSRFLYTSYSLLNLIACCT